jgi:DNA topoisomerase-3
MTPAAIREGFERLRSDKEMQPLADAAVCRSEADWLVGINGTRAMTAFNSRSGGFQLTTVGRVQTPTLAILVEREERIRGFSPRNYWEVHGTFRASGGEYVGRWFDAKWKKNDEDSDARAERLWDEKSALALVAKCTGQPGEVTEEAKPTTQGAPLLYDLTTLQREANGRFGLSARTTLSLAQALYEKHKALTYPRTDSRALPEDYLATVKKTMEALTETNAYSSVCRAGAQGKVGAAEQADIRQRESVRSLRDHPDARSAEALERARSEALRFRRQALPRGVLPAGGVHGDDADHARGRASRSSPRARCSSLRVARRLRQGSADGREHRGSGEAGDKGTLAAVKPGERVTTVKVDAVANTTRPPPRLTEATLLSAMEGAGKLIDDEELREAMREKGLGTPRRARRSSRASDREVHLSRRRELVPTAKAFSLLVLLHGLSVPELFLAGIDRRMGIQARANGAREAEARRVHARDRRDHRAHRRPGEGPRERHDPGDFGALSARCPKCGGESTRTTRSSSASRATSASGRSWADASSRSAKPTRCCASARSARSKASAAGWGVRSPRRSS